MDGIVRVGGLQVIDMDPDNPAPAVEVAVSHWLNAMGQMLNLIDEQHAVAMMENVFLPLVVGFVYGRVGKEQTERLIAEALPQILREGLSGMQAQNMRMN